jgi:hypothetical protein
MDVDYEIGLEFVGYAAVIGIAGLQDLVFILLS